MIKKIEAGYEAVGNMVNMISDQVDEVEPIEECDDSYKKLQNYINIASKILFDVRAEKLHVNTEMEIVCWFIRHIQEMSMDEFDYWVDGIAGNIGGDVDDEIYNIIEDTFTEIQKYKENK